MYSRLSCKHAFGTRCNASVQAFTPCLGCLQGDLLPLLALSPPAPPHRQQAPLLEDLALPRLADQRQLARRVRLLLPAWSDQAPEQGSCALLAPAVRWARLLPAQLLQRPLQHRRTHC